MTDEPLIPDTVTDSDAAPKKRGFKGVRKFVFAMGILVVFWFIFGEIIPHIFFRTAPASRDNTVAITPPAAPSLPGAPQNENPDAPNARIAQLEMRIKTLEDTVAALKTAQAALPENPTAAGNAPAAEAHASLDEDKLGELDEKLEAQQEVLAALQNDIKDNEAKYAQKMVLQTAYGQLRESLLRGEPYAAKLDKLKQLSAGRQAALDQENQLAANAKDGLISVKQLKADFTSAVNGAFAKPAGSLAGNLQSLIRVRKVGAAQGGEDDESIIARAEAKLDADDIEGCIKELTLLSPAAAPAFASWINKAQSHQHTLTVLDALELTLSVPVPAATPATPAPPAE